MTWLGDVIRLADGRVLGVARAPDGLFYAWITVPPMGVRLMSKVGCDTFDGAALTAERAAGIPELK